MFDILNYTLLTIFEYKLSIIEFIGVMFGFWSVYLATKNNIHTWSIGIINVIAFFIIFYQSKLYSSMFLQVFFFFSSIYGWFNWGVQDDSKIKRVNISMQIPIIIISIFLIGFNMKHFNSSYPYIDASIIVLSIFATYMMIKRIISCWTLWVIIDIISIILYAIKGLYFISFEYIIFLLLALKGGHEWFYIYLNENPEIKETIK